MEKQVIITASGPFRLLLSIVLANEQYKEHKKTLLLVKEHNYQYDELLALPQNTFDEIHEIDCEGEGIKEQLIQTYLMPKREVNKHFTKGQEVVLFGISSPLEKHIMRLNKLIGNRVHVYSEGLGASRFFVHLRERNPLKWIVKTLLSRYFGNLHEYESFFVYDKRIYKGTRYYARLKDMPNLFATSTFQEIARAYTKKINLKELRTYDTIFIDQPMGEEWQYIDQEKEKKVIDTILAQTKVLVLLHPRTTDETKYDAIKQKKLYRSPVPNELLIAALDAKQVITYESTLAMSALLILPTTPVQFYPLHESMHNTLQRYAKLFTHMSVSGEHILDKHH